MTKISALNDIGTSVASNDVFVLVDASDPTTPNKKVQQQNLLAAGGLLPDGSTATPGLRFLNDTDTGIYRSGSNTLGLVTGASTRLYINSSGRVGLGTSTPTHDLTIGNTAASDFVLALRGGVGGFLGWDDSANCTILQAPNTRSLQFRVNSDTFSAGTMAMHINSSGNVGIGTTSPSTPLHVESSSGTQLTLERTGFTSDYSLQFIRGNRTDQGIHTDGAGIALRGVDASNGVTAIRLAGANTNANDYDRIEFTVEGSERARIDNDGRLLVGTSTSREFGLGTSGGTIESQLQIEGESTDESSISLARNDNNSGSSRLFFGKSRGTTNGSNTIVQDGDKLGEIVFEGTDGSKLVQATSITAEVDGTPGANDMPGRLVFYTTADGASSPTERMRITSDAYVRLASGTGGIQFNGDTAAANALNDYEEGTHTTTATCTSGTVTLSSSVNELAYTKIGKMVTVHGRITVDTISSPTGNFSLSLPFATADLTDTAGRCAGSIRLRLVDTGYDVGLFSCSVDENSSDLQITYGGSTDSVAAAPAMKVGTQIWISITYRTT